MVSASRMEHLPFVIRMVERYDDRDEYNEVRPILVGMAKGCLLSVVYTDRDGVIRLISVRKASKRECDGYCKGKAST